MSAWQIERDEDRIAFVGELHISDTPAIWRRLREVAAPPADSLTFDLAGATTIDGAAMALIVDRRAQLITQGIRCEIVGGNTEVRELVGLFHGDRAVTRRLTRARPGTLATLGASTEQALKRGYSLIGFAGELVASLRRPRTANVRSLPALITRAGADGVPIVLVLNFLVGFVMAFQSTQQLKLYGANVYVADIVGISITRELAPLMTAIIMAGRSGAAYAAELGTMRVSEEIDALRTLGFAPMSYLVLPRIAALAIAAPVLTLLGDVVGIGGGIYVGARSLDVTPAGFLAELRTVLVPSDVWTGVVKSVAFGIAIAFIGCQQGLTASGAASGVGRSTTSTVVQCLFTIVVVDTLFTVLFRGIGA
ncbi:MAG TPA: MlaE family lipid ABC transporter permease subunit [Kofleriaceae bacterium]|nr:MlaE family lipid ABC transporter permease subunit [Kofleriaceae bacterium]